MCKLEELCTRYRVGDCSCCYYSAGGNINNFSPAAEKPKQNKKKKNKR